MKYLKSFNESYGASNMIKAIKDLEKLNLEVDFKEIGEQEVGFHMTGDSQIFTKYEVTIKVPESNDNNFFDIEKDVYDIFNDWGIGYDEEYSNGKDMIVVTTGEYN